MTHICISSSLSVSPSLRSVAQSLPAVIKLVIYSKQRYNPVTTFPSSTLPLLVKTEPSVWWREEPVLNGQCRDVIWISVPLFLPPLDGCGAGFVCLNVSTLEELHSCGHLDHIGGLTERVHAHTNTHTHRSLTL